jgi:hypothetical protein
MNAQLEHPNVIVKPRAQTQRGHTRVHVKLATKEMVSHAQVSFWAVRMLYSGPSTEYTCWGRQKLLLWARNQCISRIMTIVGWVDQETRPPLHIDECWSQIREYFKVISHIYFI